MNSFFYCKNKEQEIELGKEIIVNNNNSFKLKKNICKPEVKE